MLTVFPGEMISQDFLPQQLTSHCLDILRKLSSSERDLIRIVVEVIHELRDNDTDEEDMVRLSTSHPAFPNLISIERGKRVQIWVLKRHLCWVVRPADRVSLQQR